MKRRDINIMIAAALVSIRPATSAAAAVHVEIARYRSSGQEAAVEIFRPAPHRRYPVVVLLHGRGGPAFYGGAFRNLAQRLAAAGFLVLVPRYFEASKSPDSPDVTSDLFETWRKALVDVLTYAAERPDVDPGRIGLAGVSLGGFLAAVEAAQDDRVAALVSESAGVSTWFPPTPRRMPPTLIVHSREDATVPLSDAMRLGDIARRFHVVPELALFAGGEHVLTGRAAQSADERIARFFTKVLRPGTH